LQRGFDLARKMGAPVHVCLFVYDPLIARSAALVHPDVMHLARKAFLDQHREWLASLAAAWDADGLTVHTEAIWAPVPQEAVLVKALELRPAVVVKDAGDEPPLRRILHAAPDWKIVRYCPAPLLLVHSRSGHLPERVLAAVDTSPYAEEAVALNDLVISEAERHARLAHTLPHLAHAFPYLPAAEASPDALASVYEQARRTDETAFRHFAARHGVPPQAQHWLAGEPAAQLAAFIQRESVDLLVVGSVHRSTIDRLFLGSVSEALIQAPPCDVLLVKPPRFVSDLSAHLDVTALQQRVDRARDASQGEGAPA
jgi:universal stress protein E